MRKKSVFNSFVSIASYDNFIDSIFSIVERKVPGYVCFANVHMIIEAYKDTNFRKIVNNAIMVAPDGKPLSVFLKLFRGIKQERVCGMDILPEILRRAASLNKSVYFYGTTEKLLKAIVRRAKKDFPALKVAGYLSPPFKEKLSNEETAVIRKRIKDAEPDLIMVALGCPKQEKWMAENKDAIGVCMLGLGQAFHIYGGIERRSPRWMQKLSLEWIFRLMQEPRRLWKRYAFTNGYFMLLVAKYFFRNATVIYFRKTRLKRHVTTSKLPKLASA
jgi:N-acetylglucosaminyldiphosphoundecaprenol N-acetyl-beta-D-mannosaminyltransferase